MTYMNIWSIIYQILFSPKGEPLNLSYPKDNLPLKWRPSDDY